MDWQNFPALGANAFYDIFQFAEFISFRYGDNGDGIFLKAYCLVAFNAGDMNVPVLLGMVFIAAL